MRRWWSAAAGVSRRLLSSSSASAITHVPRSLPPPPFVTPRPFSSSAWQPLPSLRLGLAHPSPATAMQVRHLACKDRSRAPQTPTNSKVKKYKMKAPSSMKFRFKTLKDGQIRRWRAGKRHNAHLKSKEAKRRLRKPALVHLAYAKVIKKLNFCG